MNLYEKFIFIFIAAALQALAIDLLLYKILHLKVKNKKKQFFLILLILTVCQIICGYSPNQFRFILSLLSIVMISYIFIKCNISQAMFNGVAIMVICSLCEIIVSGIFLMLKIDSTKLVNNFNVSIYLSIVIAISIILISCIKPMINMIEKFNKWYLTKEGAVYYMYVLIILIYLIVAKNGLSMIFESSNIINIVIFILVMILFAIILNNENKNKQLTDRYHQTLNYVQKYEKIITEQGKANHEFKNQLMVIKGYAMMNSKKLNDYLDALIDDVKKVGSSYLISQVNKFPDGGVKGLLYYKLSIMEDEKINYEIYVENGIKTKLSKLDVNIYKNITKILGVILDNAIEASREALKKSIIINVSKENNKVVFNITNTYKGKINIAKLGSGYSTKGSGRGFGLSLVDDILNKNECLSLKQELVDDFYSTKLYIIFKK